MNKIEAMLKKEKANLDKIDAPDELEARLRSALDHSVLDYNTNKKRKAVSAVKGFKIYAAAMLVILTLTMFNYDAIAFYGKQLLGYEQVMSGTLKQLNELGKGQIIGKSYTFEDGGSLTIDYVMLDENQLLLFYTIKDPSGHVDNDSISPFMRIKAFWGEYNHQNSQGKMNEDKTEIKFVASFEPPLPFEKKLSLQFSKRFQGKEIPGEISFTLNRNTAMGYTLKKDLNRLIQVDETKLKFESISASPTKTVIKGSAQSIWGLAKDHLSGERFRPNDLTLKLLANGEEVPHQGRGLSTDVNGITFHSDFDPLPSDLNKLQLQLVSFGSDHDVKKQFKLDTNSKNQVLKILGQEVVINEIKTSGNETLVTISSKEFLLLTKIYLIIDGERISLEETIMDEYIKEMDGTVIHKRTLRFLGVGEELELDVQRMAYSKMYNEVIDIPLD